MLCLYSFGIQPALFGKKKLKKIKKERKIQKEGNPKVLRQTVKWHIIPTCHSFR